MGRMTGTQRRAATVALVGLVCTQLTQTVADSQSPLVVATAAGSLLTLAAVINTPGLSQLFGCTPLDPLGWGQAFLATGVASVLGMYAPAVLDRLTPLLGDPDESVLDDENSGVHQEGVDFPDSGRQQPRARVEEDVRSGET